MRIKKPKKLKKYDNPSFVTGKPIYASDAVNTCYEASKSCVAGKIVYDYEKRAEYLGKRVKESHESVLEHSNLIILINCPVNVSLMEVLAASRYLKANISPMVDPTGNRYVLLGGTIRGYKNLIRDMYNQSNYVLNVIKKCMDDAIPSELLLDFADSHAFNLGWDTVNKAGRFSMRDADEMPSTYSDDFRHTIDAGEFQDLIEFINVDPVSKIYDAVKEYGFNLMDVIEICSVTIKFKNMTRIISQQLTRHRNGITQESQRYVSSVGAQYNTPDKFKNIYPEQWEYTIVLEDPTGNGSNLATSVTLPQLSEMLISVYGQLINQNMLKEDARYFLPQNTHTTVYMTFTVKSLFQFLQLRCDNHAQAEIRRYANAIREMFIYRYWRSVISASSNLTDDEIIENMLVHKYMYSETHVNEELLEESIGIEEETVESIQATAEVPTDPEEEMKDFGLTGDKPAPPDKSLEAAEGILQQYDPNRYADTREKEL